MLWNKTYLFLVHPDSEVDLYVYLFAYAKES